LHVTQLPKNRALAYLHQYQLSFLDWDFILLQSLDKSPLFRAQIYGIFIEPAKCATNLLK